MSQSAPLVSIVIPVHNEQDVLDQLFTRLFKVMDPLHKSYEIIIIEDGSRDNSAKMLDAWQQERPDVLRIVHLNGNFGQHMAIMAGFEKVEGEYIVTMDADLQNPPEEIPRFIQAMEAGHDVVGGYRNNRQDSPWRLWASRLHNLIRAKLTPQIPMKDEGCMLRGYHRRIVKLMVSCNEACLFIPALGQSYASNPIELGIGHAARETGHSNYNFYKLVRYNFDLITGFSLVPLQFFTFLGVIISTFSLLFVIFLFIRRLIVGPEAAGVFTLLALMFFLIGVVILGLGIIGEYIGRIYLEVRQRPRYLIKRIQESQESLTAAAQKMIRSKSVAATKPKLTTVNENQHHGDSFDDLLESESP